MSRSTGNLIADDYHAVLEEVEQASLAGDIDRAIAGAAEDMREACAKAVQDSLCYSNCRGTDKDCPGCQAAAAIRRVEPCRT